MYVCMYIASVKDFINHYYDHLSVNMNAEVVTKIMVSHQLLGEESVSYTSNRYQKNCLILQKMRLMSMQTLTSFSKLLLSNDSEGHVGKMLIDGG